MPELASKRSKKHDPRIKAKTPRREAAEGGSTFASLRRAAWQKAWIEEKTTWSESCPTPRLRLPSVLRPAGGLEGVQEVLGRVREAVLSQGAGENTRGTIAQSRAGT